MAAPSANRFGQVSPTTAADVRADLGDDVDVVLDGGPCRVGVESTIVDCSQAEPAILRLGGVPRERIESLLGRPVPLLSAGEVRAPGTLASHYAPVRVELVDDADARPRARTRNWRAVYESACSRSVSPRCSIRVVEIIGVPADTDAYAHSLYRYLREADAQSITVLLAVAPPAVGLGAAVADRLRHAAGSA